ncbi:MAG: MFS transporter [Desulfobacterales bacterium]|nr:MFS transporter [Desulfobacterales bacterium]
MEKIPLLLLFLGHVWVDASQGILPVVLVKFKELFALSYFQVGVVMTLLNVSSSVIQPLFGYIADRLRMGWSVPWGILWTAVCMGLLGWAPNYPTALLLVGFAGLGTAVFHPRGMMAASLISGSRKGLGTAIFSTGGNLGFALGPMVGGFLILGFGIHATVGMILPWLLIAAVIYLYPGDFLRREVGRRTGSRDDGKDRRDAIPWVSLFMVCIIVTLRSWTYMSFITYLPMYLQIRGLELRTGSLILTTFLACGAVAGLYGGHLSDRIGRRSVIVGSMLLYPIFSSLFMVSSGVWLWLLAGASGAMLLASFSVTVVLTQELLPGYLGLASGLVLGLGFGMGGVGTALTGWIADMIGLHKTVWFFSLIPALVPILAAFIRIRPAGDGKGLDFHSNGV